MASKKRCGFKGTAQEHKAGARRNAEVLRLAIKRAGSALSAGNCASALDRIVDASQVRGQYVTERTWVRGMRGQAHGGRSIRALIERFSSKCVK